jgi:hypothetical protein
MRRPRTLIVALMGGLGNQLFQYAAARRLALVLGATLKFDLTSFECTRARRYRLGFFNIDASCATSAEVAPWQARDLLTRVRRALDRRLPVRWRAALQEPATRFIPEVLRATRARYIRGYWQSERYFADIADIVRAEVTLRDPPSTESATLATLMHAVHAVAIHVRRTDYVGTTMHPPCTEGYYRTAMAHVEARVACPHYFVFSDDIDWARRSLQSVHPLQFVTHNGTERDYEDLWLMSQSRHHIIANSSFSWWGAWLGRGPHQLVIAPHRWFGVPRDTRELLPSFWVRV